MNPMMRRTLQGIALVVWIGARVRSPTPVEAANAIDHATMTTEFSRDLSSRIELSPIVAVVVVFLLAAAGSALSVMIRPGPPALRPRRALLGGLLGALVGLGLLQLPFVEIRERPLPTEPPMTPPASPEAIFLQDADCLEGPDPAYSVVTSLDQEQTAPVEGQDVERAWWWIRVPGSEAHCWVMGSAVRVSGDTSSVPIFESPPESVPGCWVRSPQDNQDVCVVPCPPNAQPGGECSP